MHRPFHIDMRSLPEGGKDIVGTELPIFFDLKPEDDVRALSPLEYSLHLEKDDDEIVITGRLAATFSLECGCCLERFEFRVEIDDYEAEIPFEKDMTINLTDTIREDTLVALPSYPRCEAGNVRPRQCPAEGKFQSVPEAVVEEPENAGRGVWDALNKLN
jgi:uncharacterized protein